MAPAGYMPVVPSGLQSVGWDQSAGSGLWLYPAATSRLKHNLKNSPQEIRSHLNSEPSVGFVVADVARNRGCEKPYEKSVDDTGTKPVRFVAVPNRCHPSIKIIVSGILARGLRAVSHRQRAGWGFCERSCSCSGSLAPGCLCAVNRSGIRARALGF